MKCIDALRIYMALLGIVVSFAAPAGDTSYPECDLSTPLGRIGLGKELPRVEIEGQLAIAVPGDNLEALIIARSDLINKIALENNAARKHGQQSHVLGDAESEENNRFLSDSANYFFYVVKDGDYFRVRVSPKPYKCVSLKGGGAVYKVDVKTKRILEKEYTMEFRHSPWNGGFWPGAQAKLSKLLE